MGVLDHDSLAAGISLMESKADGAGRIRLLREEPHTQKVAEAAVGLATDNGTRSQESAVMEMDDLNQ